MDAHLQQSMLRYYDDRAPEYEEAYVLGTGTASIPDPNVFRDEASLLGHIVERVAIGRLIDLACGTAYWLPRYASGCSSMTLFDQSERMLEECKRKTTTRGIDGRCSLVRGDFFEHEFNRGAYDSALVGFFLSHPTEAHEPLFFKALEDMLDVAGRFLILDSAWSPERARFNGKAERQERHLNDGTRFEIYERYFDRQDISGWAAKYRLTVSIEHFGRAFFALSGRFTRGLSTHKA